MSDLFFRVDVFSHHFVVSQFTPRGRDVVGEFARPYYMWGYVRKGGMNIREVVKVFAARTQSRSEYRFHIGQYQTFLQVMGNRGIHAEHFTTMVWPVAQGAPAHFEIKDGRVPFGYQVPIIEYLADPKPPIAKLLEIQTGKGKSYCFLKAAQEIGERVVGYMRPQYIEKWVSDVQKTYGIGKDRVLVIQGSAKLMALIQRAKEGTLDADVIMISNKTMQSWISLYESMGRNIEVLGYDCMPYELLPLLKAGVRLVDEVHQDFHLNFKLDLYTHVPRSVSLTATLEGDDAFLNRMTEIAYPLPTRYRGLAYDKYIDAACMSYNIREREKIRTKEYGSVMYSHHAFEKSVMKNPRIFNDYCKMIVEAVKQAWLHDGYQKGDRCLVYCAGIEMATRVTAFLKNAFADKDVRRYVEDDPYENLMEAELSVSTLLSAGTGHDIAMLTAVVLTPAVSSSTANIQGFGRLRKIEGRKTNFIYFTCLDIPKHMQYHEAKKDLLARMAHSYRIIPWHVALG